MRVFSLCTSVERFETMICPSIWFDKLDKWAMAGEKRQTCWPKLHIETEFESQLTAIR